MLSCVLLDIQPLILAFASPFLWDHFPRNCLHSRHFKNESKQASEQSDGVYGFGRTCHGHDVYLIHVWDGRIAQV